MDLATRVVGVYKNSSSESSSVVSGDDEVSTKSRRVENNANLFSFDGRVDNDNQVNSKTPQQIENAQRAQTEYEESAASTAGSTQSFAKWGGLVTSAAFTTGLFMMILGEDESKVVAAGKGLIGIPFLLYGITALTMAGLKKYEIVS